MIPDCSSSTAARWDPPRCLVATRLSGLVPVLVLVPVCVSCDFCSLLVVVSLLVAGLVVLVLGMRGQSRVRGYDGQSGVRDEWKQLTVL